MRPYAINRALTDRELQSAIGGTSATAHSPGLGRNNPRLRSNNRYQTVWHTLTQPSIPCCTAALYRCWGIISMLLLAFAFCAVVVVWRDNLLLSHLETQRQLLWASVYTAGLPVALFSTLAYLIVGAMQKAPTWMRLRTYSILEALVTACYHLQLISSSCSLGIGWHFFDEYNSTFATGVFAIATYFFAFSVACVWIGVKSRHLCYLVVLLLPMLLVSVATAAGMLFRTRELLSLVRELDDRGAEEAVLYQFLAAHVSVWRVTTLAFVTLHVVLLISQVGVLVRRRAKAVSVAKSLQYHNVAYMT